MKLKKKTIHFEQFLEIEISKNFEIEFVNDDKLNQNIVLFIEKTRIIIFVSRRKRRKIRISILRQIIIEKKNSLMLLNFFRKNIRIYAISWKTIKIIIENIFSFNFIVNENILQWFFETWRKKKKLSEENRKKEE